MKRNIAAGLLGAWLVVALASDSPAQSYEVEAWRAELYAKWKELAAPPITPYSGPFAGEARAFVGAPDLKHPDPRVVANYLAKNDYKHVAERGVYDPELDPRPINAEFEAAVLEDWRRMGYNCAYKGAYFNFMVGAYLKRQGMLGAIDQTLFGQNGPPPIGFDGSLGNRYREGCGSFFHPDNFQAGVDAITGMGRHYGQHLFTVGDHRITCSWDEVGMRTRSALDYHENAIVEFRVFLRDVWFQDESPDRDTNHDGRTYNGLTGERLTHWDQVEPPHLTQKWAMADRGPEGGFRFSSRPEVDAIIFQQPGRTKLWIDFHRYYTFEFFRRINEQASDNLRRQGAAGRISCYPFVQHFSIWPGMNQQNGTGSYWYHRLSPVVCVEHCWPDAPTMSLNYAICDRLAPRFRNLMMGWVWLYFGREGTDMYNGPHDIDRALARMMGHIVDGSHHWLYSPIYRGRDQKQRLQIAWWQSFLATHYATFLARSTPMAPQIAVLSPDWTGYFYRQFQYPKHDWAYTMDALQNLQYGFHVVTEEEIELHPEALRDYKALYVVGSEWSTPTLRERIREFINRGGVVFANVDSLSLDIATGRRVDFLETDFGVKIERKFKNGFFPSAQSVDEAVWALEFDRADGVSHLQNHFVHMLDDPRAWSKLYRRSSEKYELGADGKPRLDDAGRPVRHPDWRLDRDRRGRLVPDEAAWRLHEQQLAKMPPESLGIPQSPLNMRSPPTIRYEMGPKPGILGGLGLRRSPPRITGSAVSWSEVDSVKVARGRPIAWWGDLVCGVETDNTVWLGTREGASIHATAPRMEMHRGTEPCNPYPAEVDQSCEQRRTHVEAIGYAAIKAGVRRPVTLRRDGQMPMNLEVLPRAAADGTLMAFIINHDATDAAYQVSLDGDVMSKLAGAEVWDLIKQKTIERNTDGQFDLRVAPWGVSVFMVGQPAKLQPIKTAQAALAQKDLSVPQYFRDRPELNTPEYDTPIPALEGQ